MKKLIKVLPLIFIVTFISCKKVISLNLKNAGPQRVIMGEVTNAPGPYHVTINSTVNFSDDNNFPPVTGATVVISDNAGLIDSLIEASPGIYTTHTGWQGQPGNTYTLIVIDSGARYTAVSTMPAPVPLDSLGFAQVSRRRNTVIEAVPYFQDPPGIANYYEFTETINDTPLNKIFIFDDRLSDGKYIHQPLDDDSVHLNVGDQIIFSMFSIDKNVFQYFSELQQLLEANPFNEATPANPDTNLSGGALGYFSAHTTQTKIAVVQ